MESILTLSVGGLPPFSARGCIQTLIPKALGFQARSINGQLLHWGDEDIKYATHIECRDQTVLATNGLNPGADVVVECIQPLWQRVESSDAMQTITLDRRAVEGTIKALTSERQHVPMRIEKDGIHVPPMREPIFICYRPKLHMKVQAYELCTDEWGMTSGWKLEMEEV